MVKSPRVAHFANSLCNYYKITTQTTNPVTWVATMATWARARARGAGFHGPVKTPLLAPVKGLHDPAMMTVEQGGRGGRKRTGTGDVETAGRTAGPSGAGERGATTKILSR